MSDGESDRCPETGEDNCQRCSGEYCDTHFLEPCDCATDERHWREDKYPTAEPTCPSCGVPYTEHKGLTPLCAELAALRIDAERYRTLRENKSQRITVLFADISPTRVVIGDQLDDAVDQFRKGVMERIPYSQIGLQFVGRKLRGVMDGLQQKTVTLRVVDVTFGGDVVIHRRSYGQFTISQELFLKFAETAKDVA